MDHDLLQRARKGLVEHAKRSRDVLSAAEWEDAANESAAGRLVGERCVDAIVRVVWGIGGRRLA